MAVGGGELLRHIFVGARQCHDKRLFTRPSDMRSKQNKVRAFSEICSNLIHQIIRQLITQYTVAM